MVVLQITGSPTQTGLTGSFLALPQCISGILGGAVIDLLGYRRVSIAADLVSGAGIAAIPLLYATGGLAFWQILTLVSSVGCCRFRASLRGDRCCPSWPRWPAGVWNG